MIGRNLIAGFVATICIVSGGRTTVGALIFSSDGQSVVVPYSLSLDVTGPLTIEVWVKPDAGILARGYDSIVSHQMSGSGYMLSTNFYSYADTSPGGRHSYAFETGGVQLTGTSQPRIGQWTHLAGVWDAGVMKLYVDGQLESQTNQPSLPTSNLSSLFIGSSPFGTNTNWRGAIDDVAIWARPLSQSEITDTMNNCLTGDENGLVAFWAFNEGQGQTSADLSGHGNTAMFGVQGPAWGDGHCASPVPEPTSLALWSGLGAMGLIAVRRRRKQVA